MNPYSCKRNYYKVLDQGNDGTEDIIIIIQLPRTISRGPAVSIILTTEIMQELETNYLNYLFYIVLIY